MSYIDDEKTLDEFLKNIRSKNMREQYTSIVNQFDLFCKSKYNESAEQVLKNLSNDWENTHKSNKIILVLSDFVDWCLQDHLDITYFHGKYNHIKKSIKAKHPRTIRLYVNKIRQLLDDVWDVEVNINKVNRKVKIPKPEDEEPEPFTKEQMRIFLDSISNIKKLQFMVLKDTGMRIQEFCQIRKNDVDINEKRIKITIQAGYTKTKKARICYITRETEPSFLRLYKKTEKNGLLFGTNEDREISKGAFQTSFAYYRNNLENTHPEFTAIHQSNGRHKKTIHSIRSYTSTQCAIAIDENWGHEYIGHKKYLGQYIRNQDKFLEKFIRSENQLMVYDTIEVVDSNEQVKEIRREFEEFRKNTMSYNAILEQISELKAQDAQKEMEIQQLRSLSKN
jgi:integrase